MAVSTAASPNSLPQSPIGRLLVTRVLTRW